MVLDPAAMATTMIARAIAHGLVDQPPYFGLSRTYKVIATGVVKTLLTPVKTLTTATYTGQPVAPPTIFGTATIQSVSGMDSGQFRDRTLAASLFTGPFSIPFFEGIAGIVDYFQPTVTLLDLFVPIGSVGTGLVLAGGIVMDAAACFDNMHKAAIDDGIMVVRTDYHLNGNPNGTFTDFVTQQNLKKDDLFSQPGVLLLAIATQLQVEIAKAHQEAIPVVGNFFPDPPIPPITAATITTILL